MPVAAMPDNVRALRGNPGKRKGPKRAKAVAAVPSAPSWLSREAAAEWRRVTPELERVGLLARIDRAVLTGYCETWAKFVAASKEMTVPTVPDRQPGRGNRKHPAWQVYRESAVLMAQLARELGLSPASRAKIVVPERAGGDESDLD